MDELLAYERDEYQEYHPHVGYLYGKILNLRVFGVRKLTVVEKAEEQGFSRFHLYVCAAFLVKWTDRLLKMDFQVRELRDHQCVSVTQNKLGNYDVPAGITYEGLDGQGDRIAIE
jgi:hypothetical protein